MKFKGKATAAILNKNIFHPFSPRILLISLILWQNVTKAMSMAQKPPFMK